MSDQPNGNVLRFPVPVDQCPKCRMTEATLAQSVAITSDLTHALRTVAPEHPVLESLGAFVEVRK